MIAADLHPEAMHQLQTDLYGMTLDRAVELAVCLDCWQEAKPRCRNDAEIDAYLRLGICGVCIEATFEGAQQ